MMAVLLQMLPIYGLPAEADLPLQPPEVALGDREEPIPDGIHTFATTVLAPLTRHPFKMFI